MGPMNSNHSPLTKAEFYKTTEVDTNECKYYTICKNDCEDISDVQGWRLQHVKITLIRYFSVWFFCQGNLLSRTFIHGSNHVNFFMNSICLFKWGNHDAAVFQHFFFFSVCFFVPDWYSQSGWKLRPWIMWVCNCSY